MLWWASGSPPQLFTFPGEAVLFRAAGGQPGWPGTTWDVGYEVAGPTTPRKLGATLLAWPGVEYQARGRRCLPWHLSGYLSRQQSLADGVEWAHVCTRVCVHTHADTFRSTSPSQTPHQSFLQGRPGTCHPARLWSLPSPPDKLLVIGGTLTLTKGRGWKISLRKRKSCMVELPGGSAG